MKKRNGFVSNSSSCSFIAIGTEVKESDLDKRKILINLLGMSESDINNSEYTLDYLFYDKIYDLDDYEIKRDSEDGYLPDEGNVFICKELDTWEYDEAEGEISLSDFEEFKNVFEKDFGIKANEVKIIYGVQCC